MSEQNVNVEYVLQFMKEQIGNQAQEIAVLKAALAALGKENDKV